MRKLIPSRRERKLVEVPLVAVPGFVWDGEPCYPGNEPMEAT
jgi:hypothetical protein